MGFRVDTYVTRSGRIEAVQYLEGEETEQRLEEWFASHDKELVWKTSNPMMVSLGDDEQLVELGDWIIYDTINNTWFRCPPRLFSAMFEPSGWVRM